LRFERRSNALPHLTPHLPIGAFGIQACCGEDSVSEAVNVFRLIFEKSSDVITPQAQTKVRAQLVKELSVHRWAACSIIVVADFATGDGAQRSGWRQGNKSGKDEGGQGEPLP